MIRERLANLSAFLCYMYTAKMAVERKKTPEIV